MATRKIGDYRVIREHGRGGMGAVLQALSPEGVTVALKTVLLPERGDPRARWEAIERFQREARAARTLDHPNICRVLDFGADEDTLYIVMEFLDGETVRQLIDLGGAIELRRAGQILRGVGEALAHAHDKGIVHRDIKPGNIMILHSGQVKLTDFGVAAIVREAGEPQAGETTGTPLYMSPEQARGEEVDARSDIFSLGATFYEMLTGRRPFQGDDPEMVMNRLLTMDPPPIPGLPGPISRILERCLRKDPRERFQSAQEMLAALSAAEAEGALDTTGVLPAAAPTPAPLRGRPLARLLRTRVRRLALAAAAVAVLAGAALFLLRVMSLPDYMVPPSLGRLPEGYVATYLYDGVGRVGGIAAAPDGTLLVTAGPPNPTPPGVYWAGPGDHYDPTDAYTQAGQPFVSPGGIAADPDWGVLVADSGASTVWVIPAPGAPAEVLTDQIPRPADVVVAPPGFESAIVSPGDVLVCVSSSASADRFGLYVVDHKTEKARVRVLVGRNQLQNGLVHADFGPNGTLYAVDDDRDCTGVTILTISPTGEVTTVLPNFKPTTMPHPCTGPLAVDPATGDVLFAYRSVIYRVPARGGRPEQYAVGDGDIAALEFSPDGSALFVDGLRDDYVVKIAPRDVEGRLLVAGYYKERPRGPGSEAFRYVMSGASDMPLPLPTGATGAALSPVRDEVCYLIEEDYPGDQPWLKWSDIWKADLRGGRRAKLTEAMGAKSINCQPLWSPDGRRIAFIHCAPVEDELPCVTGLDVWVMNANGTDSHLVGRARAQTGLGSESCPECWWSAAGDRLLYRYGRPGQVVSVKADGTEEEQLRIPSGNISPDGYKIVDEATVEDVVDGEPGVWRQLYRADADGKNRRVICQQFLKDSDIAAHLDLQKLDRTKPRWQDDVREWVGPRRVKWSPSGDCVAFLGARPFSPTGREYYHQVEVWTCDILTGALTRLTENEVCEDSLSWAGPIASRSRP